MEYGSTMYSLGASQFALKIEADRIFKIQNTDAPMTAQELAGELAVLPPDEAQVILATLEEMGLSPVFIAKVEQSLPSGAGADASMRRMHIMLAAGSGIAGLVIGIIIGRATKK
jgi:hypothetical protein